MLSKTARQQVAGGLFLLWLVLLLPWLVLAPMYGMVLDAGPQLALYISIGFVWTYPISVWLVWKYRDDVPFVALVPVVNIAGCIFAAMFSKP